MKHDDDIFKIDEANLDRLWFEFPKKYMREALALANAREELERAKAAEEVAEAEVDRDVRRNPSDFGLEKITETVVKNTVLLSKKYQAAHDRTIKARHSVDIQSAYVSTLDSGKKALEMGVQLLLANYLSTPREKNGGTQMRDRAADKAFGRKREGQ